MYTLSVELFTTSQQILILVKSVPPSLSSTWSVEEWKKGDINIHSFCLQAKEGSSIGRKKKYDGGNIVHRFSSSRTKEWIRLVEIKLFIIYETDAESINI